MFPVECLPSTTIALWTSQYLSDTSCIFLTVPCREIFSLFNKLMQIKIRSKLNNQHVKSFSCCKKTWSLSTTSLTRSRDFQSESHMDEIKTAKFDAQHSSLHSFSRHWQCFNEVNNSVGDVNHVAKFSIRSQFSTHA